MSPVTGSMPRLRRSRPAPPVRGARHVAGASSWSSALLSLVVWGLLSVSVVPLALEVREGEVSQTNVRSPRKLTYTSQVRTKLERERAASAVQEVVEIDPSIVQKQRAGLNSLLQDISAARNAPGLDTGPAQEPACPARTAAPGRAVDHLAGRAWTTPAGTWCPARRSGCSGTRSRTSCPSGASPRSCASCPLRASDQLTENERSLAVDLASRFVAGNLVPNREATARLRKEAEEAVAPVQVTVEKGETVLREGQVVTAADIEKLDLLGLRNPTTDWRQVGAAAAFAVLTMSMLAAYIAAFQPNLATPRARPRADRAAGHRDGAGGQARPADPAAAALRLPAARPSRC